MFSYNALLSMVTLAVAAASSPIDVKENMITLPFSINLNLTNSNTTIADIDRARAKSLKDIGLHKRASVQSVGVTNTIVTYTASVGIGKPATQYTLLVDTGSSNTWIGASKAYKKTSTSIDTKNSVAVSYGSGSFSGEEYLDTVTISSGLVIKNQSIGVASKATGFSGQDGILGIGPVDLTARTLSNKTALVPTVTDNLFTQGTISSNMVGVSYNPINSTSTSNGELTFGGTDSSKFIGSIYYQPITTTSPSSLYWGINQSVMYGSTPILSTTAGIVDTGTTLVLLASDAYQKYVSATNATLDAVTGLLRLPAASYSNLQNMVFSIGTQKYTLFPNAQIWPRSLNSAIGGNSNYIYLIVSNLGSPSGQGLDFINGYTFLERFYTVYDTANHRVGIANTQMTHANVN